MNRSLSEFILDDDFLARTLKSKTPFAYTIMRQKTPEEWFDRSQLLRSQIFQEVKTKEMLSLAQAEGAGQTLLMQKVEAIFRPWNDLEAFVFEKAHITNRYKMFQTFVAFEKVLDQAEDFFLAESEKPDGESDCDSK
ncbi:MAG: hypothetical protein M1828_007062, partial [Chrysothrix sp. TS-e1954]